jgi:hypothetical protein
MNQIKEAIRTDYGKLRYVIQLTTDDNKGKLQLYIDSNNKIYFESNEYSFSNYPVFDINTDAHRVAKEIFLTYLQAEVKTRLLELKQLELVLDELGLKEVIRKTIIDNSSILIANRNEIVEESIKQSSKLIDKKVRKFARKNIEEDLEVSNE